MIFLDFDEHLVKSRLFYGIVSSYRSQTLNFKDTHISDTYYILSK